MLGFGWCLMVKWYLKIWSHLIFGRGFKAFANNEPYLCINSIPSRLIHPPAWINRNRSLSNDHGNDNHNARKQWYHWLNKEEESCCTCGTHFNTFQNNNVKFLTLRFWRQRKPATVTFNFCLSFKTVLTNPIISSSSLLYVLNET